MYPGYIINNKSVQGRWSPDSYLFYNVIFMGSLLWAIHNTESDKPAQLAISVNLTAACLDIITIYCFFPSSFWFSEIFSVICALGNFIFRFVTLSLLSRICIDSSNGTSDGIPPPLQNYISRGTSNPQSYEDIDQAPPQQTQNNAPFFTPYR
ncbi:uncharacterized protein LOC126895808 isoform X2 [Daktulosphaira vitifoliae]|uniref:uncharacterized protein LOC126895808 isoform X2 n=1 Tax=Daktulosphaira vitifoliae TaxID=58002 RepID=UPI0021AA97C5|nr:uncharacterized protein LOC126895808 isoform X2 [Daktulosphaira vitifoliae]